MATEEYYCPTEDPFISKKAELTVLKGKLTSQLSTLIEEKEAFNFEIQNLSNSITQSREDKILLIQSMTQSAYTHEERVSATHSLALPSYSDEVSQHNMDGMSPNNKKCRHQSNRDEDYIERRGRKPKTLRVNISLSNIHLPPGAMENMNNIRDRNKKSHKKHSIQGNHTQTPWILNSTDSNGIHSPAQINYCPPKINIETVPNSKSPPNTSETQNLIYVLNSADHSSIAFYLQNGDRIDIHRDDTEAAEGGPAPTSENQSPNSNFNKTLTLKLEEETEKIQQTKQ